MEENKKFCKHCGEKIAEDAVICPKCGRQVEEIKKDNRENIIINNNNNALSVGGYAGRERNKWVALCLCLFLGFLGGHKFYEGKAGMGILYIFTGGLFCIGVIIDLITIICKPNPYYV